MRHNSNTMRETWGTPCSPAPFWVTVPDLQSFSASAFSYFKAEAENGVLEIWMQQVFDE